MTMNSLDRIFWSKVRITDTCWIWTASKMYWGYGCVRIRATMKAHRLSWAIHYGPIPKGLNVLHRCDNPPCVRPDHLFLGTLKDNTDDMMAKGRHGPNQHTGKTHCKRGHEFTPENTRWWQRERQCKTCQRELYEQRKARKTETLGVGAK